MSEITMLAVLPCGVRIDKAKGEGCATNCPEPAVKREKDPKLRHLAVDKCRHWQERDAVTKGKAGYTEPSAKPRRKAK